MTRKGFWALAAALLLLSGCSFWHIPEMTTAATTEASTAAAVTTPGTTVTAAPATTQAPTEPDPVPWSVFIYMCGTDLETEYGAATLNLAELTEAEVDPERVNVLVQTGGTSQWQCGFSSEQLERYRLLGDGFVLEEQLPLASMGEAETLADFLRWGVEAYPAQRYMVLFWDHGGGSASGAVFDELFDDDSLELTELREGLAGAGVSFELIGFDTCLMASLETAAAAAPYGRYLVASEETEPGGGWDYQSWLHWLSVHADTDGGPLGQKICDSYMQKCRREQTDAMATLSLVDLDRIGTLTECFDRMAGEMETKTEDITSLVDLVQCTVRAENYGGNTVTEGYANMVDLGDLILQSKEVLPETAEDTLDALLDAVIYQVRGGNRAYANGLSVFYPLGADAETCDQYARVATSENYLRFIETVVIGWEAPDWVADSGIEHVDAADYEVRVETDLTEDAYFQLTVTAGHECAESVRFSLYYMDYDENCAIHLGTDDDMYADWDEYCFRDNFRGVWLTLDGCWCAPNLIAQGDEYNIYSIPVLLNGRETNLRAEYHWDDESYTLLGVYDGMDPDTGMASRDIRPLEDGDVIEPLFTCIDADTGEVFYSTLDEITVHGGLVIEESALEDGDYLYQFEVTDVFGRVTVSDSALMVCEAGEIYVYLDEEETEEFSFTRYRIP